MCVVVCVVLIVGLGAPAAAAASIAHTVQEGDTLWALAARYRVSVEALARANDLGDIDRLQLGQRLVIPSSSRTGPRPVARISLVSYTVRVGDTLWTVARQRGMSPEQLAQLNQLDVDGILRIGQTLKVPGPVARSAAAAAVARPERVRPRTQTAAPAQRRPRVLPYRGTQWAGSLIGLARRFMGTPYRWGGTSPGGFDCSGFLYYVYGRMDVRLPRRSYDMFQAGRPVPDGQLRPGDVVFFTTYRPGPSHAGIYLGDGRFLHASSGFGSVTITPLGKDYYRKRYLGARRF